MANLLQYGVTVVMRIAADEIVQHRWKKADGWTPKTAHLTPLNLNEARRRDAALWRRPWPPRRTNSRSSQVRRISGNRIPSHPSHNLAPDFHNSNSRVIPSMLAIVSFVQILLCTFPCCQRRRMIALERRACKFGIVRLTFVLLGRLKKIWSNEVFELFLWRGWRLYVVDVKKRFVVCCNSGNLVWGELHCRKSPSKIY